MQKKLVHMVQTPTLIMLTDQGEAISHFRKEKYYHVRLCLSGAEAASGQISDRQKVGALKAACEAETAVCVSLLSGKLPFMDVEMRDFAARTLAKVERMTEAEFAVFAVYPDDEV